MSRDVLRANQYYHFSGSLPDDALSYVEREADQNLLTALKAKKLCYVLNARQMGKSSLRIRILKKLEEEGNHCISIDLNTLGSLRGSSKLEWYRGLFSELTKKLNLKEKYNIENFWEEPTFINFTPSYKLSLFFERVLQSIKTNIFIFIDEIDSLLDKEGRVDDFFDFVRSLYENRSESKDLKRINFAFFGVATPYEINQVIGSRSFNIGHPIKLSGFKLEKTEPLTRGWGIQDQKLSKLLMQEILKWTSGQPFLSHYLCEKMTDSEFFWKLKSNEKFPNLSIFFIKSDIKKNATEIVENLVREEVINQKNSSGSGEIFTHLNSIDTEWFMMENNKHKTQKRLQLYKQILEGNIINNNEIDETKKKTLTELQLSGLIIKENGRWIIFNRIYEKIFNIEWVNQKLGLESKEKQIEKPPVKILPPTPQPRPLKIKYFVGIIGLLCMIFVVKQKFPEIPKNEPEITTEKLAWFKAKNSNYNQIHRIASEIHQKTKYQPSPRKKILQGQINKNNDDKLVAVRFDPEENALKLAELNSQEKVDIIEEIEGGSYGTKYGIRKHWYKIRLDSREGYIAAYYVNLFLEPTLGTINFRSLNFRDKPNNSSAKILETLNNGDQVTIQEKVIGSNYLAKAGDITRYHWYYVIIEDGKKGYVAADYIFVDEKL